MTHLEQLDRSLLDDLRPFLDAVVASLHEGVRDVRRELSVTLPSAAGRTLAISIRTGLAQTRGLDARQLSLVNKAIDDHLAEPITVSMLSTVAGLSRSHFSNAFRATVGRTPHAHVVIRRIQRAKDLMLASTAALSDIALATGFSDQAHFSNKFRRSTGMTPTQWRRAHQGADHGYDA